MPQGRSRWQPQSLRLEEGTLGRPHLGALGTLSRSLQLSVPRFPQL